MGFKKVIPHYSSAGISSRIFPVAKTKQTQFCSLPQLSTDACHFHTPDSQETPLQPKKDLEAVFWGATGPSSNSSGSLGLAALTLVCR